MAYGLNITGGSYYGSGSTGTSGNGLGRIRSASSANFNTMSRNVASGYSSDIELIQKYLEDGKTDKAIEKYESLFDDIKKTTGNYNYSLTDSEVQSILKNAYEGVSGTSIIESIETNTSNSFWTGFKQSIPIIGMFVNDTSEAEALAKLAGDEVSTKEKVLEFIGGAVGTILFAGLGVFGMLGKLGTTAKAVKLAGGALAAATAATAATETVV